MLSAIDPTRPLDGVPAQKSELRANLAAAKSEIEHLMARQLPRGWVSAEAHGILGDDQDYTSALSDLSFQLASQNQDRGATILLPKGRIRLDNCELHWKCSLLGWGIGETQIRYSGGHGPDTAVIRLGGDGQPNMRSLGGFQIHAINPATSQLAESCIWLDRAMDWGYHIHDIYAFHPGRWGFRFGTYFNLQMTNIRGDRIGHAMVYLPYRAEADPRRGVVMTGLMTMDNDLHGSASTAQRWLDGGYLPAGSNVAGTLDWFNRAWLYMECKAAHVQMDPLRLEQEESTHPDWGLVVDNNQESNSQNFVELRGPHGFFKGSIARKGWIMRSLNNRCHCMITGFGAISGQRATFGIGGSEGAPATSIGPGTEAGGPIQSAAHALQIWDPAKDPQYRTL
jgi:hypothetical protein